LPPLVLYFSSEHMSKPAKKIKPQPPDPQKEWEQMIARMSDAELKEYSLRRNEAEDVRIGYLLGQDQEWEAMMDAMGHDERIAYLRRQCETMLSNPDLFPEVPPDVVAEMKASLEEYDKSNEDCKVLEQRSKFAVARRDGLAEA
jgi:hypothetical protein